MPAILGSSNVIKSCARSDRGQSGVLCAVACADIDLATFRDDHDTLTSGHRRFRGRVCLGRILPSFVIIRDSIHQRSMGLAAILAILQDKLVFDTVKLAAKKAATAELQLHSDQGFQYTSTGYLKLTKRYNITPSMSRRGNPYDNAVMENFFGMFKTEAFRPCKPQTIHQARMLVHDYIDYYNNERMRLK